MFQNCSGVSFGSAADQVSAVSTSPGGNATFVPPDTSCATTNSCAPVVPINPVTVLNSAGGLVFHAGGNTGTISFQISSNQFSGTDDFPNWIGSNIFGQSQIGITCSITSGSFTVTSATGGTIEFVRTNCNGQTYEPQTFVGTWSTPDFVHIQMSGAWTWQLPNTYMPDGGPWDIEN